MTTLEKGKFIKNFVRINKNNKLIRFPHSNKIGYSKNDVAIVEPQVDITYWNNWEKYLHDLKEDGSWEKTYNDWQHFLFSLNSIPEIDIKKYDLPTDFIIVKEN